MILRIKNKPMMIAATTVHNQPTIIKFKRNAFGLFLGTITSLLLSFPLHAQTIEELRQQLEQSWNSKDWVNVEKISRQILTLPTASASDKRNLAIALDAQNKIDEALTIRRALADEKTNAKRRDYTYVCWTLITKNTPLEARPYCLRATELLGTGDSSHTDFFNLGHTYLLAGDTESAKKYYEQNFDYVHINDDAELQGLQSDFDLFIKNGWHTAEAQSLKPWLTDEWAKHKQKHDLWMQVFKLTRTGKDKYDAKDYQGAIADYTAAMALDPKEATAVLWRGNAKEKLKDYQGAIADYTAAMALDPKDATAVRRRGNAKRKLEDYQGAIVDYTAAMALDPKDKYAAMNRGLAKNELKDYQGAIADYTAAMALDPKDAVVMEWRANAKRELKDYEGAIADYTAAITLDPTDQANYISRASVVTKLCESGRSTPKLKQQALDDVKKASELKDAAPIFRKLINKLPIAINLFCKP